MLKDGVNEIKIESYDELINLIRGKDIRTNQDLREDFIFRGLSNIEYELIPSSLRRNNLNQLNISEYIEPEHKFKIKISKTEIENNNLIRATYLEDNEDEATIYFDNEGTPILNKNSSYKAPENKLQNERELYILMKFFNYADKSGLKINAKGLERYLIHHHQNEPNDDMAIDIEEIMSLAQHYGLPTKALDWSYDFKVSLYFAVKDILNNTESNDGVLWALNYKLVENEESNDYNYHVNLNIYRPEYNTNPNLNAQKGLFTYLERYVEGYDKPLDKLISYELNQPLENRPPSELYGKITTLPTNISKTDTIFYKFIIPKELKAEILKELYLDNYSEEYLFPGYNGVSKHIINELKLNKILKETKTLKKNILLSINWNLNELKNKEKLYEFTSHNFEYEIDKIFIYQNHEVIGYFKGNEIIKDTPEKLWKKFGKQSGISMTEFSETFKDCDCFAIRINDLNLFKYHVKLCEFELNEDFCYIKENDENLNFLLNFK